MANREQLLASALRDVLIADGVLNDDTLPTGPHLLLAAESYVESKLER
jgi:hypothetical protein